jgi:hypothetical protein
MRKHWILCCFLLLSLIPLSCSQKECEWRHIARFANYEVEHFQDLPFTVVSGNSTLTEPFSVHGRRLSVFCVGSSPSSGFLRIDLYRYPGMKFVKTMEDDTWTGERVSPMEPHSVPVKAASSANVRKGLYCLYVSSGPSVSWAVTVSECV